MSYGISTQSGFIKSERIQRALDICCQTSELADDDNSFDESFRHLRAIETLEARGAKYSNHDFDVLSAALAFLRRQQFNI